MSRFLAILILLGCAMGVLAQAPPDVPADHWAYDAVRELVEAGYLEGFPDETFRDDRTLTRHELATVVTCAF